jgi:flavin reductase (DIM6/NTAB) family NADH-FMN oxidoreductase RutF
VEELLKAFMRGAAQQVYAVTARVGSAYAALTATSVTSVSLRPPLMLVSIGRDSRHHPLLISADHIVVSMLGAGAERASAILAEPGEGKAKLEAVGYRETEWGPVIEGSIGYLALRRYSICAGGDHDIILGEVVGGEAPAPDDCPLVYHQRAYSTVSRCGTRGGRCAGASETPVGFKIERCEPPTGRERRAGDSIWAHTFEEARGEPGRQQHTAQALHIQLRLLPGREELAPRYH